MVKAHYAIEVDPEGAVDVDGWLADMLGRRDDLDEDELRRITAWLAREHDAVLVPGLQLASIVADLNMDEAAVCAGLLYRGVRQSRYGEAAVSELCGDDVAHIVRAVAKMAGTSLLDMTDSSWLEKEHRNQVENVRGMLISMINDVRVAVVKLAERLLALRNAKVEDSQRRQRIAEEALAVFAPLAGRLGIWQLKWELEDLSLRYTEPQEYQRIAKRLQVKRTVREKQVDLMVDQVRALLRNHGVDAQVYGRAKNIYSIWRKMLTKNVSMEQVYDIRAVRVVVDTLADCYAALGIIHSTWEHVPSEFDDYIANPKANGYQSIHTAVTANDQRALEIQIRTQAMHEDAELGVCAHWNYKAGADHGEAIVQNPGVDAKMEWLRQVLDWHEELAGTQSLPAILKRGVSDERIYLSTPKGHVLDLPSGSTVLDFAYRVHTDVGSSALAGQVNGVTVRLDHALKTADQVEIVTGGSAPRREWLERDLGFVQTDRARAKLTSHFRELPHSEKTALGQALLMQSCTALGLPAVTAANAVAVLQAYELTSLDELYTQIGGGARSLIDVATRYTEAVTQAQIPGIGTSEFPLVCRFRVAGANRDGLLHDLTDVIGTMDLDLTGTTGRVSSVTDKALLTVDVTLPDWRTGLIFVTHVALLPGVDVVERLSV